MSGWERKTQLAVMTVQPEAAEAGLVPAGAQLEAADATAREYQSERELLSTAAAREQQSEWELLSTAAKRLR